MWNEFEGTLFCDRTNANMTMINMTMSGTCPGFGDIPNNW